MLKHVEEYNKLITKQEFVHLVGQLLRLYVEILKLQSHEPTVMITCIYLSKIEETDNFYLLLSEFKLHSQLLSYINPHIMKKPRRSHFISEYMPVVSVGSYVE